MSPNRDSERLRASTARYAAHNDRLAEAYDTPNDRVVRHIRQARALLQSQNPTVGELRTVLLAVLRALEDLNK